MHRREALQLLAGAAALPLLSRDAFSLFHQVQDQLRAASALKTLNPHQDATVTTIAELIIPQTETPGAKAARVNEFIDVILTDWYDDQERSIFLNGLADVDARSRDLCGKDFVDCSAKQQTQILTALDEELTKVREAVVPGTMRRRLRLKPEEKNFFYMMKQLTLVGYYTSEVGSEQELHYEIIPSSHAGCAKIEKPGSET
jgi:Gluconate 2-dehydrogenase subunit 3